MLFVTNVKRLDGSVFGLSSSNVSLAFKTRNSLFNLLVCVGNIQSPSRIPQMDQTARTLSTFELNASGSY